MASTGLVYDPDATHPALEEDATRPTLAYPASKIAAESELRGSGLNWSILRLAFVYGDGDGHLASVPPLVSMFKWHPAKTFSLVHQRDVAAAVELALTGAMDGLVVNVCDDAPATLYEMAGLAGSPIESSAEPLSDPWMGRMDGTRLRGLGFQPTVATDKSVAIVDQTGLTGNFDFSLEWGPDSVAETSGENDRQTYLLEALKDQLGLKLESRKLPIAVLLIDHINQRPTETRIAASSMNICLTTRTRLMRNSSKGDSFV